MTLFWVLLAFWAGGTLGFFTCALLTMAKSDTPKHDKNTK